MIGNNRIKNVSIIKDNTFQKTKTNLFFRWLLKRDERIEELHQLLSLFPLILYFRTLIWNVFNLLYTFQAVDELDFKDELFPPLAGVGGGIALFNFSCLRKSTPRPFFANAFFIKANPERGRKFCKTFTVSLKEKCLILMNVFSFYDVLYFEFFIFNRLKSVTT